jgi:acetolactate synthase II small subunit
MNQHTLKITADDQPAMLERMLQVARYRGFVVAGITALPNATTKLLDIDLSVRSRLPIEHLTNQLNKLIDIRNVSVNNIMKV